ncbi:MAG: hypothetical protein ACYCYN_04395 [Solirubrobacteraceae bacterium]
MQPAFAEADGELVGKDTLTSSTASSGGGGEFALETAEGELPIRPLSPAATLAPVVVNGAGALFASSVQSMATFLRPSPLGVSVKACPCSTARCSRKRARRRRRCA